MYIFESVNLSERKGGTLNSPKTQRELRKQTLIVPAKFWAKSARKDELIATQGKLRRVFLTRGAITLARTVRYPW